MGFGKKTDYATGRVLDLDKAYSYIIKPAAEEAGLACKRADEIFIRARSTSRCSNSY